MHNKIIWKRMIYHGSDLGDFYLVSDTGEIRGVKSGIIRKKNINHEGYYFVGVSLGSRAIRPCIKIHRAVAETFLNNKENYPVINHIDGNKLNNNVENLEWCTVKQNAHHAIENNLYDPGASSRRPVRKIDKNSGECLQVYNSITDAEKAMGILKHTGTIGDCIRGRIKSAYGYKWTYNNI